MRTRSKFWTGFLFVFLAVFLIGLVVSGVAALIKNGSASPYSAQKGYVCEFSVLYAKEACTLKRTVNFIPTNKEHFYLVISENDLVPFLVRESPSWFKKNFTESGIARDGAVKIKGAVTRYHSYELTKLIDSINADLSENGLSVSPSLYIDALYKQLGGLRILAGAGIVIIGALMFFGVKSGFLLTRKPALIVLCVAAIGVIGLTVYVLGMY